MELLFAWSGLLFGPLGIAYAVAVLLGTRGALSGSDGWSRWRGSLGPAGLVVVAAILVPFGLSLLRQPPFAAGGLLGWGWLVGGVSAALLAFALLHLGGLAVAGEDDQGAPGASALMIGASGWTLLTANATALAFPGDGATALMGFAMAFCTVCLLASTAADADHVLARAWRLLAPQALLALVLAAGAALGAYHFSGAGEQTSRQLPAALAGVGLVVSIISTRLAGLNALRFQGARLAAVALVSLAVMAPVTLMMTAQVHDSLRAFACAGCGLVGLGLAAGLIASSRERDLSAALQTSALVGMVVLAAVAAEFRLLAGYGVALGLCAAWVLAIPLLSGLADAAPSDRRAAWAAALMPVLLAWAMVPVYRLFTERYEAHAFDAMIHYAFVGAAAGVLTVLFVVGAQRGQTGWRPWQTPLSMGALALLAVLLPLLLVFLWGENAGVGVLAGLVIGALLLPAWQAASGESVPLTALLLVALMALGAYQFAHLVAPLMEASRSSKLWVVLALTLLAAAWVVLGSHREASADEELGEP